MNKLFIILSLLFIMISCNQFIKRVETKRIGISKDFNGEARIFLMDDGTIVAYKFSLPECNQGDLNSEIIKSWNKLSFNEEAENNKGQLTKLFNENKERCNFK
ncbi:MAG: hypothetical protein ACRCSK_03200 [Fusobacteriaceae bacterium]